MAWRVVTDDVAIGEGLACGKRDRGAPKWIRRGGEFGGKAKVVVAEFGRVADNEDRLADGGGAVDLEDDALTRG